MNPEITQKTLDDFKKAQQTPSEELAKSITVGTGLLAYDLQAPAKNLYPHLTPIRNVLPRIGGGSGTGSNWRQINAIVGSGVKSMGWIPEGQRAGLMSYTTANKSSTFVTLGEDDNITFEAINAGRTFEDLRATMAIRLLQMMMEKEEFALIGGNATIALGTPGTPTVSAVSNTSSTLPTATYKVQVVALTLEGYYACTASTGVVTSKVTAGADGDSITLNGGSSNVSAESAGQAVTVSTTGLGMSVAAVSGAVGYAWYISSAGGTGDETLQAITTTNWYVHTSTITGSRQAATAITGDHSRNTSYAFDGLLTGALTSGSGAYVKVMATGTVGTGTTLTASGVGGVTEIDDMFQSMWDNYQVSPTVLYVNSQELRNITKKVLSNSSSSLLQYTKDGNAPEYGLTASGTIQFYYNPFTIDGGRRIPVRIHPNIPAGTILGWAEDLPNQYQNNHVPNVAQVRERKGYYQIDWPVVTRKQGIGVYCEEVLELYAPFALGVITNIANG